MSGLLNLYIVLSWNSGTYPYLFVSQNFVAIKLRFPLWNFYAKEKEKTDSLQTLLQKEVRDLETHLCPKVENIKSPIDNKLALCTLSTYRK